MGLSFRKSFKIGKNTKINFSKSGIGISTGVKGARINVGPKGVRKTFSIPGTGIRYTKQTSWKKSKEELNKKETTELVNIKTLPDGVELIKIPKRITITISVAVVLVILSFFKIVLLPLAAVLLITGFIMMLTNKEYKTAYFMQRAIMFYQKNDYKQSDKYCDKASKYGNNESIKKLKCIVEHLI